MNIRGNRFNVCFYNAAGTFFMHKHILQYFYSLKSSYNFIQNFIVLCLQNKTFLTLLRALGIICKIITEPYFVKATEVRNILLMGSVFQRLLYVLDLLVENKIIIELKSVESLNNVHLAQVLTYLKLSYIQNMCK